MIAPAPMSGKKMETIFSSARRALLGLKQALLRRSLNKGLELRHCEGTFDHHVDHRQNKVL
jgi:hypothetical protein